MSADADKIKIFERYSDLVFSIESVSLDEWPLCEVGGCLNRTNQVGNRCYPHSSESDKLKANERITENMEKHLDNIEEFVAELISDMGEDGYEPAYLKKIKDKAESLNIELKI